MQSKRNWGQPPPTARALGAWQRHAEAGPRERAEEPCRGGAEEMPPELRLGKRAGRSQIRKSIRVTRAIPTKKNLVKTECDVRAREGSYRSTQPG